MLGLPDEVVGFADLEALLGGGEGDLDLEEEEDGDLRLFGGGRTRLAGESSGSFFIGLFAKVDPSPVSLFCKGAAFAPVAADEVPNLWCAEGGDGDLLSFLMKGLPPGPPRLDHLLGMSSGEDERLLEREELPDDEDEDLLRPPRPPPDVLP